MRIGCIADLHYGIDRWIDQRVRRFIDHSIAPAELDLLVVAGDLAESVELAPDEIGVRHEQILTRLRQACGAPVAFCAGNHDIWTSTPQVASSEIYHERLTAVAARTGTTYLDHENLLIGEVAVVGCYGHFDFSLRVPGLRIGGQEVTDEHYRRQTPPGYPAPVWMDGQRIRWSWNDPQACAQICAAGAARMESALGGARAIVFVSHGVPRNEVNGHLHSHDPLSLFLNAFSGTAQLERIIRIATARDVPVLAISGHTHLAVARAQIEGVDYLNVGGTYGKLRMVVAEFPEALRA